MRVLITSQGASSHFFPLVPLAKALAAAGHEVTFGVPSNLGEQVVGLGFQSVDVGRDWDTDPDLQRLRVALKERRGAEQLVFGLQELFIRACSRWNLRDLEGVVGERRPDVIVSEGTEFAGGLAAERYGIPAALVSFGLEMPKGFLKPLIGTALDELRAEADLPADPDLDSLGRYLRLGFAPSSYQPAEIPLSPTSYLLRPEPFDAAGDEALPEWVAELPARPTIYATLGTVFADTPGVFESMVDGLAGENVNVVATVSRDIDPAPLRGRAPNLRVEQYIPNSLLLPHCHAVVAHAGYGTVMGSLSAGLPMVLLPLGADQPMHAGRCTALGCAVSIERADISADSVRSAVRRVLDDASYRKSAQELAAEISSMPDASHGVKLIERLVETGRPVFRELSS